MVTKLKAVIGVGLAVGIGVALAPLTSYADTDSEDAYVQAGVPESITITEIVNMANIFSDPEDVSAGQLVMGAHFVHISTNAANGWTLAMRSSSATLNLRTSTGPNVYGGAVGFSSVDTTSAAIVTPATTGDPYNEATVTNAASFPTSAPLTGFWGFRLEDWEDSLGELGFASVPTSDLVVAAENQPSAHATTIMFGVQVGTATPVGAYGAWITYTAATQ
jgi:hypothetical protein